MRSYPMLCLGLSLATFATSADDRYSLNRGTPVPADQPIPALDFFRPSMMRSPKLNETGTHVAAIVALDQDRMGLGMFEIGTQKKKIIHPSKTLDVYKLDWMGKDKVLFSVSEDDRYASGIYTTDLRGNSSAIETYSVTEVVGIPRKQPQRPIIWVRANAYDDGEDGGVLQIDAKREIGRYNQDEMQENISTYGIRAHVRRGYPRLKEGMPMGFLSNKDGELAYGVAAHDGIFKIFYLDRKKWIPSPLDLDEIALLASGDSPGELIGLEPHHRDGPRGLARINAATGEVDEAFYRHPDYDLESVTIIRHPKTGMIIGVKVFGIGQQTKWFDPHMAQIQSILQKQFRGQIVSILGMDQELNKLLLATYSDRQPPVYHTLDWKQQKLALFARAAPWIDPQRTHPMQLIQYKTRDGHEIEALLTLPTGASTDHPVPLIVYPHGGPWVADSWGWQPSVQFLASRGYAVFQPNYRGSTGYDWKFSSEDMWDFEKMHHDVTDGVKAVLSTGLFDSERVAIMGGSFGGYLSLAGVTREPDLYKCAVSIAGVFDWELIMRDARRERFHTARYQIFERELGDPADLQELFDRISPIKAIDQIQVPVFVAHGKKDEVVSIEQSKRLVSLLKEEGVPHIEHFVRNEGHGMRDYRNQIDLYETIEDFLGQNL